MVTEPFHPYELLLCLHVFTARAVSCTRSCVLAVSNELIQTHILPALPLSAILVVTRFIA